MKSGSAILVSMACLTIVARSSTADPQKPGPPLTGLSVRDRFAPGQANPETHILAVVTIVDRSIAGSWTLPAKDDAAPGPVSVPCTLIEWNPGRNALDISATARAYDKAWAGRVDWNDKTATECIRNVQGRFSPAVGGDGNATSMVEGCYAAIVSTCSRQQEVRLATYDEVTALKTDVLGTITKAIENARLTNDQVQAAVVRVQSGLYDSVRKQLVKELQGALSKDALTQLADLEARLKTLEGQAAPK